MRSGDLSRQGTWAVVDQVFSSGTNFIPSLVLARILGPQNYGTFSLAFLAWFLALSVIRSALMQPYTLAAAPLEPSESARLDVASQWCSPDGGPRRHCGVRHCRSRCRNLVRARRAV